MHRNWLITGATGFIGTALVEALLKEGCTVRVLSRDEEKASKKFGSGITAISSLDQIESNARIDAVVNLAGEPLFGGPWTKRRKRAFRTSRIGTTNDLIGLFRRLKTKPKVLISGSAIGYYGMNREREFIETDHAGSDEMARLCHEWEQAALPACDMGIRLVKLRIGLVLDKSGGMLEPLSLATKLGLGARLGTGKQWMSWITRHDLVNLILFAANNSSVEGPLNATAPQPVRQKDFADALANALQRPRLLVAPAFLLSLLLRDMAPLLLEGQKVLPQKALDLGFEFAADDISKALV